MPTLAEFTLSLRLRRDEESGTIWTIFRFATVREFRAFRYEIQVDDRFNAGARTIDLKIQGVQAPTNLMPSAGAAIREIGYPGLLGEYHITLAGARRSERFTIAVGMDDITLIEAPGEGGPSVVIEKGIENVRA